MSSLVNNSSAVTGYVTVFAKMEDGTYKGEVMQDCHVGNPSCWAYSTEEVVARIEPGRKQLHNIVAALTDGRLHISSLDGIGHYYGGKTLIWF